MRRYVITGAASGIGQATYRLLRDDGHLVLGVDLRGSEIAADLSTAEGRRSAVDAVFELAKGRIDGVAACAGISKYDESTISVNYFGALATLEGLRPLLASSESARAVAVTSFASVMPFDNAIFKACLAGDEAAALLAGKGAGLDNYTSTKQALAVRCRQLAVSAEWGGAGILLNMIAPGIVDTPMVSALVNDPEALRQQAKTLPMVLGRPAKPQEMAHMIRFLLSSENSYMIGQQIFVDGGAEASVCGGMGAMSTTNRQRLAGIDATIK